MEIDRACYLYTICVNGFHCLEKRIRELEVEIKRARERERETEGWGGERKDNF